MDAEITGKAALESLNVEALTMDPKFGSLTFDKANNKLDKIRHWLIELDQLDYKNYLPEDVVNNINNSFAKFDQQIEWLRNFDIKTSANPKIDHDNFESQIDSFYNSFYTNFVVNHLSYLRQEADQQSQNKKRLIEEQKKLAEIRQNYEHLVKQIQGETKELSKAKSERAAVRFGKHFEIQSKENQKDAEKWLEARNKYFGWLMKIIAANLLLYLFLFITHKLNWWPFLKPSEFFTLEYGLVKLALLSLLSYAISFSSRNFNVNSNLVSLEKHRKNVAETLNDFLDSDLEKEDRSKIVEKATDAMFTHRPIGYLPKIESKDDGPVSSVLNVVNPFNKG